MEYEKYVGQTFGNRYRLEKIIGVGGMAVVFKAVDVEMNRHVAVKLLKEDVAADEASVQRFINESKAVAMLSHPNIVNIYDVSMREQLKYIVMEYIEGTTLKNYMNDKKQLPFREVLDYTGQILSALQHAHEKGIVHRDIKPQNIMLLKDGTIKVTDFGIAKLPNAETVTMSDKAIGTVFYISPEQASGKQIDNRSDLYSLGIMMYEMLGGQLPFNADNQVTVAMMQITATAAPLSSLNASVPKGLEQVVAVAMEKEPGARYQNAAEMLRAIDALKANPRVTFTKKNKIQTPQKKRNLISSRIHAQSHSMFPIILGIVIPFLVVAIVCGIVLAHRLTVTRAHNDYQEIHVPTFVSRYYSDELADYLASSDIYEIESITYSYDANVSAGYIIEQIPAPGVTKKVLSGVQKCAISLVISTGAETVTVPNFTIEDYRVVKTAVTRAGLQFRVVWETSEAIDYGYVIRTSPAVGEEVKINTEVTIVVSRGLPTGTIIVPDFSRFPDMRCYSAIRNNCLTIGTISQAPSDEVEAGLVLTQSPAPGTRVTRNTPMNLVFSSGPDGVPLPMITGMAWEEAELYLRNSFLLENVTIEWIFDPTVPNGAAIRTDPPANEKVFNDTPVVLYVSKGSGVAVPPVAGLTLEEAKAAVEAIGCTVRVERIFAESVPHDLVIDSIPAAGEEVPLNSEVVIYQSRGPEIVIESLFDQSIETVRPALEAKGLIVVVEYQVDPAIEEAGIIIGMSRPAGTVMEWGDTLILIVTKGTDPSLITLEDYTGQSAVYVQSVLESLGLHVDVSRVSSTVFGEGQIILMSPAAGDQVAPGSVVTLIVSDGPGPSES